MTCSFYLSFLSLVISALHKLLRFKLNNCFFLHWFPSHNHNNHFASIERDTGQTTFSKKRGDEILEKELVWGRWLKPITITVEAGKKRTGTTIVQVDLYGANYGANCGYTYGTRAFGWMANSTPDALSG
jgi:hypothetical protein